MKIVEYLLENGYASKDEKSSSDKTPLLIAANEGNLEVVQYLLENNYASEDESDNEGNTALHEALYGCVYWSSEDWKKNKRLQETVHLQHFLL